MKKRKKKDHVPLSVANSVPNKKGRSSSKQKHKADSLKRLCWGLIPVVAACLLVLDAKGIYLFTPERLLVLGVILMIILLPCFSEVSIKNLTVLRNKSDD